MQPVQERPAARVSQGSKNGAIVHANIMEPFGYLSSQYASPAAVFEARLEAMPQ
jgi:hypothetical protein